MGKELKDTGKGKRLPSHVKESAIECLRRGLSVSATRREMIKRHEITISRQTLYQLLKQPKQPRKPRFRHRKILNVHVKVIDHLLRSNPEITAQQLQKVLLCDFGVSVTIQTISLIRRKLGWTTRRVKYCQLISNKNKQARMDWCLKSLSLKDTFEDVIFTDETAIEMSASGRIFFYKKKSEFDRLPGKSAKPKNPYKVLMWGGISYRGRTPCCIFTGIMDSVIYQQILSSNFLPFVRTHFSDGYRFYQDKDSKHVSRSTKQWMVENEMMDNVMVTPASSPDLNPIENVWSALKDHLQRFSKTKKKRRTHTRNCKLVGESDPRKVWQIH